MAADRPESGHCLALGYLPVGVAVGLLCGGKPAVHARERRLRSQSTILWRPVDRPARLALSEARLEPGPGRRQADPAVSRRQLRPRGRDARLGLSQIGAGRLRRQPACAQRRPLERLDGDHAAENCPTASREDDAGDGSGRGVGGEGRRQDTPGQSAHGPRRFARSHHAQRGGLERQAMGHREESGRRQEVVRGRRRRPRACLPRAGQAGHPGRRRRRTWRLAHDLMVCRRPGRPGGGTRG